MTNERGEEVRFTLTTNIIVGVLIAAITAAVGASLLTWRQVGINTEAIESNTARIQALEARR
ncbi:MAG: hypothetical protein DWQ20_00945 [Actinobacteria bacterium]|nr:MAG: hypothetical protein DWQ20_00945 [Actinomycetota bacterium]